VPSGFPSGASKSPPAPASPPATARAPAGGACAASKSGAPSALRAPSRPRAAPRAGSAPSLSSESRTRVRPDEPLGWSATGGLRTRAGLGSEARVRSAGGSVVCALVLPGPGRRSVLLRTSCSGSARGHGSGRGARRSASPGVRALTGAVGPSGLPAAGWEASRPLSATESVRGPARPRLG